MIQPREEWRYHLENSNCFCIFFSVREEVARFLTYYSKAPAPLKAENVSQPTFWFVWLFFSPCKWLPLCVKKSSGTPCLTTGLSRLRLMNKWMSFSNCSKFWWTHQRPDLNSDIHPHGHGIAFWTFGSWPAFMAIRSVLWTHGLQFTMFPFLAKMSIVNNGAA